MALPGYLDPSVDSTVLMPVAPEIYDDYRPIWPQTVISQYANSPRLLQWIALFSDAIDAKGLTDAFYNSMWNIDTAIGYGLDVWGRIVGVRRTLYIPGGGTGVLGWGNASGYFGWDQAPWNSNNNVTPNFSLTDTDYRRLILVKALSNISDRSIQSMNSALMILFAGQGNAYIADDGGMMGRIILKFTPSQLDLAILQQSGAFANPSGVYLAIVISP